MTCLARLLSLPLGLARLPGVIGRVIVTEAFLCMTDLRLGRRRSLWDRGGRSR